MKRTTLAALATVAALASSGAIYPQTMQVINVNESADLVTMTTATGHIYEMTGAEDWQPGDLAALLMYNSGTPDKITDDQIITARYTGTPADFIR